MRVTNAAKQESLAIRSTVLIMYCGEFLRVRLGVVGGCARVDEGSGSDFRRSTRGDMPGATMRMCASRGWSDAARPGARRKLKHVMRLGLEGNGRVAILRGLPFADHRLLA